MGVPAELGGGGASHAQICDLLREVAHHCSSTALAASMHMHLVATLAPLGASSMPLRKMLTGPWDPSQQVNERLSPGSTRLGDERER